jgi:hypothetical protein
LLDREHQAEHLPQVVKDFEAFKQGGSAIVPDVPFQMLGDGSPERCRASSEGSSFRKAENLEQVGGSGDGGTSAVIENTLKTGR